MGDLAVYVFSVEFMGVRIRKRRKCRLYFGVLQGGDIDYDKQQMYSIFKQCKPRRYPTIIASIPPALLHILPY